MITYYIEVQGLSAIDLMLFDVYGAGDTRGKVLNLVANAENGASMDVSPGEQKMFFTYVEDVVEAYLRAIDMLVQMDCGKYEKYAVREELPISLHDFVELYVKISKKQVVLNWGGLAYREREIMNPTGIGTVLPGWQPRYSIEDGLMKYIEGGAEDGGNTRR